MAVLSFCLTLTGTTSALAQSFGSLIPGATAESEENDTDPVAELIRRAQENGSSIVIVDPSGNLLGDPSADGSIPGEASALMELQSDANAFRNALIDRLIHLPDAFNEVAYILRATSPTGEIWAYVEVLLYSLALFGVGMLFEKHVFGKRIAKSYVVGRIQEHPQGYYEKVPFLVFRFFMAMVGTFISIAVAYVLGFIIFGPIEDSAIQFTATLINICYFTSRLVTGVWRMVLSPYLPQYRIPVLNDAEARRLFLWLSVVASLGFFSVFFGMWIGELGLNYEVYAFLAALLSFMIMLLNVLMVSVNRHAISQALRHGKRLNECSWLVQVMVHAWLPVTYIYLVFAWAELTYELVLGQPSGVPLIAGAYGVLTTVIVVYGLMNFFIERSFARRRALEAWQAEVEAANDEEEEMERPADLPARPSITTFEALARRVAGILSFVAGCYAFVILWGPDTQNMGDSLPDRFLDVMVILFIGYICYAAFRIWIDSKIEEEVADQPQAELGDEGGASSASRLATLLPLFRNFVLIVIVLAFGLIILMEFGVNVGPLFAGAGIVGVAVGFGSQSLVRDIFSGAFFLFDDAFRKGEYLDVGGVKGTVESISVRSFQLRHHLGALHTIPFGEIQVMTNYSRDWVIMKLPLRVTYDTDVEKVRKLIKKLGVELLEDPVIGEDFIQPLKSQGVIEMQDSAMIIRVKFMTKPGDQWMIRKRVYQDIRELFAREGIKFAHREVTVRIADEDEKGLTDQKREAVVAAAEAAIDEDELLADAAGSGDDR